MRKISADYIFPISSEPIKNGIITIDDDGRILDVSAENQEARGKNQEVEIEYYVGVICPGFINTHCHLELSHMRGQVAENLEMTGFIKEIITKRDHFSNEEIEQKIAEAESEMIRNGIVAVGDISNNNSTFKQKAKGNLVYHTFIEVFDFNPDKAEAVFGNAIKLKRELQQLSTLSFELSNSIIPHAPYSVSDKLFELISEEAIKNNSLISIHNQESAAENELFVSRSGPMFYAFSKMGIDMGNVSKSGLNSLRTTLPKLPSSQKTLLVHNTYTSEEDIEFAENRYAIPDTSTPLSVRHLLTERSRSEQAILFWCTCPNANMYIENKLPNYNDFINKKSRVTIGTDSLASNHSLSILDELKIISKHFPEIPLQMLLLWATKNGANFLGFDQLGTIEKGKKPGLNLLKNIEELTITSKTEVIKLI